MIKQQVLTPIALIGLYSADTCYYVEAAPIDNQGNAGAFRAMSRQGIRELTIKLNDNEDVVLGGEIPSNMLYVNYKGLDLSTLIWYTEPQRKSIIFQKGSKDSDNAPLSSGMMNLPYLVWKYSQRILSVVACFERPVKDTLLYYAPLMNIYNNLQVCMGSGANKIGKGKDFSEIITSTEKAFFQTVFTHFHQYPFKKKGVLYREHINSDKVFTMDMLFPIDNHKKPFTYANFIR